MGITNKAKCLICGEVIESKHRHDFQCCSCGNLCVDGGQDYFKRTLQEPGTYQELSDGYKNETKNVLEKEETK